MTTENDINFLTKLSLNNLILIRTNFKDKICISYIIYIL